MRRIAVAVCAALITSALAADTPIPKPPNLGWVVTGSKKDDKIMALKVRNEIPDGVKPALYPNVIEMHWKYDPDAQGMPSEAVFSQMSKLEAAIDPIQGDHIGYLMVIVTGNGERRWVWYVADPKAFGAELNQLIPDHPFPITLNAVASEPDWKTYRSMREKIK